MGMLSLSWKTEEFLSVKLKLGNLREVRLPIRVGYSIRALSRIMFFMGWAILNFQMEQKWR